MADGQKGGRQATAAPSSPYAIELKGISKAFGGTMENSSGPLVDERRFIRRGALSRSPQPATNSIEAPASASTKRAAVMPASIFPDRDNSPDPEGLTTF